MTFLPVFILSIIQGITEFLPISSSAHLILISDMINFEYQSLMIDVSLHLGTLAAVVIYFWSELSTIIKVSPNLLSKNKDEGVVLGQNLLIATIPIVIVGAFLFLSGIADLLRNIQIIALATIVFGILLYFADIKQHNQEKSLKDLTKKDSLIIGISQILAIIPGTSRAGIVYTSSRMINLSRIDAAKFSMLLSIPVILLSAAVPIIKLSGQLSIEHFKFSLIGFIISFFVAFISIDFLLKWVRSHSMLPFVIYRIVLGSVLLFISFY